MNTSVPDFACSAPQLQLRVAARGQVELVRLLRELSGGVIKVEELA